MKSRMTSWLLAASLLGAALAPMAAQAATVNGRRASQHARIRQGVQSGQLTHREARHLRTRDRRIHRSERRDRMANGGHLNYRERRHLNTRLNRASRTIYRLKHNHRVR